MEQVHLFISGNVQGVGFRQFVKSHARKLGLVGWVTNTEDNKVEAVVQGDPETIEQLIAICRIGPFLAEVREVIEKKEIAAETFSSFDITQ